jgi:hypothetical protein
LLLIARLSHLPVLLWIWLSGLSILGILLVLWILRIVLRLSILGRLPIRSSLRISCLPGRCRCASGKR